MLDYLVIRPWQPADRAACLRVFDSNLPDYFDPGERRYYARFLDEEIAAGAQYYVVESPRIDSKQVLACGGFSLHSHCVVLRWGMVARHAQGRGLGRELLTMRMQYIARHYGQQASSERVKLHTSPLTSPFYQAHGFQVQTVIPGGLGPGLDQVCMAGPLRIDAHSHHH